MIAFEEFKLTLKGNKFWFQMDGGEFDFDRDDTGAAFVTEIVMRQVDREWIDGRFVHRNRIEMVLTRNDTGFEGHLFRAMETYLLDAYADEIVEALEDGTDPNNEHRLSKAQMGLS